LHGHSGIGECDILGDGSIEKHVLLQNDANLSPQPSCIRHREIDTVDEDAAGLRHVEALEKLRERALARARRTDDADDLPGRNMKTDVVQDFRPVDAIAKPDMVKRNGAADRREYGTADADRGSGRVLRMSPSLSIERRA